MIAFFNGEFVSADDPHINLADRGFCLGDGLFETIRCCNGKPFRWDRHWQRLTGSAAFLKINLPFGESDSRKLAEGLLARNKQSDVILKINLSRGAGQRGYSIRGTGEATFAMTVHPAPPITETDPLPWRLRTASYRLQSTDPLRRHKTTNRLINILARAEAEEVGADEALLLNERGEVAEAASANVFWIRDNCICTPSLSAGALPGITRAYAREWATEAGFESREETLAGENLHGVDGVFLTQSSLGIIEVAELDGRPLSSSKQTTQIRRSWWNTVQRETA